MRRWLMNILAGLSLLLCVVAGVLWVRSYRGSDYVSRQKLVRADLMAVTSRVQQLSWTRGEIRWSDGKQSYYPRGQVAVTPPELERGRWRMWGGGGAGWRSWGGGGGGFVGAMGSGRTPRAGGWLGRRGGGRGGGGGGGGGGKSTGDGRVTRERGSGGSWDSSGIHGGCGRRGRTARRR